MKNITLKLVVDFLLGASLFLIPFLPVLPPILWIVAIVLWLAGGGFKKLNLNFVKSKHVWVLLCLYLALAMGMLWTNDLDYGFRDLRIKLPILIFPLFFFFFEVDEQSSKFLKEGFVCGSVAAALFSFINASVKYSWTGDTNEFFYINYSYLMFPGYFAICINLAIIFILSTIFNQQKILFTSNKLLLWATVIFMSANIILISEKMSMITAIVTVPFFYIAESHSKKLLKSNIKKLVIAFAAFIIVFALYLNHYNRFTQVFDAIKTFREDSNPRDKSYYNSSTIRLAEWKYGYEIFLEHPFIGVGTGDIKNESMNKYIKENFTYGIAHFETPASQYLHMAIILGLLGVAVLLFSFFYPFFLAIKYQHYVYAAFLLIYILNSITGTILTASCVLIYGFFNSFLFFEMIRNKKYSNQ